MKKTTKKLVIIIIVVLMFIISVLPLAAGMFFKYRRLGYTKQEEERIKTFSQDVQDMFLQGYNENMLKIMDIEGFDESRFEDYYYFYGLIDDDVKLINLINRNILKKDNYTKIQDLYNDEYFLDKNEDLYLKYIDNFNTARDVVKTINTLRYKVLYDDVVDTDMSKGYLILVNKYHKLAADYEPDDLVTIEANYGKGETRKEVYEQYKKLQDEGNSLGYEFTICSAYRSYDYQEGLYNKYLAQEGSVSIVDQHSARPGHSEHQSGLCLDLTNPEYGMDDFGLSDAGKWVAENCYKYGFIIRYTEGDEDITGYQAEPWQIRYVGSEEVAKKIYDSGITFDEYYACFVED